MSLIKLDAHYVERSCVGAVHLSIALNDGTTVVFPAPFLPLTASLAITPHFAPEGDSGLRIDFTHWSPMRYGLTDTARFPVALPSQELAMRVARAFDADPATTWTDPPEQMQAWLRSWTATNNAAPTT
ncbi:hypothetical protein SAMN04489729_4240 [Amycolatopsis lurida]|uniref:Uncharacterized protein n=1 Tax=Amycolatopsis lurida NRRL 2430 TaxID=1460371 RepID=A0A2P2G1T3_AMYLU|nr:hypothetical protein [Amycolatopsis lurida]KFU82928.1 hypothetical protein BB31_00105 [Amycolatopsis lurida NRRL 2430]SED39988.1 hypothetical protein SAMN04489729_4240 [Amycolatopsis lurida]